MPAKKSVKKQREPVTSKKYTNMFQVPDTKILSPTVVCAT